MSSAGQTWGRDHSWLSRSRGRGRGPGGQRVMMETHDGNCSQPSQLGRVGRRDSDRGAGHAQLCPECGRGPHRDLSRPAWLLAGAGGCLLNCRRSGGGFRRRRGRGARRRRWATPDSRDPESPHGARRDRARRQRQLPCPAHRRLCGEPQRVRRGGEGRVRSNRPSWLSL
jgi:hypothetical protein